MFYYIFCYLDLFREFTTVCGHWDHKVGHILKHILAEHFMELILVERLPAGHILEPILAERLPAGFILEPILAEHFMELILVELIPVERLPVGL